MSSRQPRTSPRGPSPRATSWSLPASISMLGRGRRQAAEWLASQGAPPDVCEAASLVISELLTNAIRVSTGARETVRLELERAPRGWRISVADRGPDFTPPRHQAAGRSVDELSVGGLGLPVVEQIAEAASVEHSADGWTVVSTVVPVPERRTGADITIGGSGRSVR